MGLRSFIQNAVWSLAAGGVKRYQEELPLPSIGGVANAHNPFEGASSRGVQDWLAQSLSADAAVYMGLERLRARSQDLGRNNDHGRQAIRMVRDNVVGRGIRLQCQVTTAAGEIDHATNDRIERLWKRWGKRCTPAEDMSWHQVQRQVVGAMAESGEAFVRLVNRQTAVGVPLQLQVYGGEAVALDYQGPTLAPDNRWILGIERDPWNKAVRYAFWTLPPNEGAMFAPIRNARRQYLLLSASEVIHVHMRSEERPNQSRGVPWLHSSITTLKKLSDYVSIENVRAKGAASLMAFITPGDDDDYSADAPPTRADNIESETFRAGSFYRLNPRETAHIPQIQSPSGQFDPYVRSTVGMVAAGSGVSYEGLSRDYSRSNYSSTRMALLQERDTWRVIQQEVIDTFLERVFEAWLPLALLRLRLPFASEEELDRLSEHTWQARGWEWVDPAKEVKANIDAVRAGFKTVSMVVADSGHDFQELMQARRRELDTLVSMDIDLDSTPGATTIPAAVPSPEPPEEESQTPAQQPARHEAFRVGLDSLWDTAQRDLVSCRKAKPAP